MPQNLENSAVATGLEKVSFHSNLKERQCQRMLKLTHSFTQLTQPITSWQINGETVETVTVFLGSKVTAEGDCSHEIKRRLLLGRKL